MVKIAINGFGRIGRNALRVMDKYHPDFELVAVNDLTDPEDLMWLVKYDTILGRYERDIELVDGDLVVGGRTVQTFQQADPEQLPWGDLGVDIVIECTGRFTNRDAASKHLKAGAKKVILSAPGKGVDGTFVMGVNDDTYDSSTMQVVSAASCTTNCLAPMAHVMHDTFGVVDGLMTTIHAYTAGQNLHDGPHKDRRRARAAAENMVPTSTGAAKAIGDVIPALRGKLDGFAMRVPLITTSATDLTVELERETTADEVNAAFRAAAESGPLAGRLLYSEDPIVSSDIVTSPAACTFDAPLTKSIGKTVKIIGWYDNEYGYTCQLLDLAALVAKGL